MCFCCTCWTATSDDDETDTDTAVANMAAADASALARATEANENAPRAAREPPLISVPENDRELARARNHARYTRTARRIATCHGRDAVTLAAYFDDVEIMQVFVRDTSVPRVLFEDALKLAVVQGNAGVVRVLLESGAAQGVPSGANQHRAPLRLAALRGNREIFALLAQHTVLREGETLSRVVQDILLDSAGRNTLAMLLCIAEIVGGRDAAHWKDSLVAAAAHVHYRPGVVRLCLALDRGAGAVAEAVDTAFFVGNAGALRVLASLPCARPPKTRLRPVRDVPLVEHVARQMRARVLLLRRNGLRRAALAAQAFRERFYSPPSGLGYLRANARFETKVFISCKSDSRAANGDAAEEKPGAQEGRPQEGRQESAEEVIFEDDGRDNK